MRLFGLYLGDTSLKRLAYTSAGYNRQPSILASINCCVMVVGSGSMLWWPLMLFLAEIKCTRILLVWVIYSFLFKPSFTRITLLTFPNEPWQLIIIVKEWLELLSLRYLIQSSQDICHEMLRYFPTWIQNQNKQ